MWLCAFPACEGSSCSLGSGDWPLGPHEILLNPQDLEKLRVSAFGYVAINRSSSSEPSDPSDSHSVSHAVTRHRPKREGVELIAFSRAIPDDSLKSGETRTPVWILRAAGLRPGQPLFISRAPAVANQSVGNHPFRFRVELTAVPYKARGDGSIVGQRRDAEEARRSLHPNHATGETLQVVHGSRSRAIARRVQGCMVLAGSLLAAEVLGETVVLRVVAITDSDESDPDRTGGEATPSDTDGNIKGKGRQKDAGRLDGGDPGRESQVAHEGRDRIHGGDASSNKNTDAILAPCLITSSAEVAVVQSVDVDVGSGRGRRFSSGGLLDAAPQQSAPGELERRPQHQHHERAAGDTGRRSRSSAAPIRGRFSASCGGREEAWSRRAPGLESVLSELHALVLLSVGGMKDGIAGVSEGSLSREDCEQIRHDTSPPPPPPPPPHAAPPPSKQQPRLSHADDGDASGGIRGPDGGGRSLGDSGGGVRGGRSGDTSLGWSDILPAGIVLCGPSGVGKTLVLDVLSEDLRERHGVHVVRLLGPQVLASASHDGDRNSNGGRTGSPQGGALAVSLAEVRARAPAVLILDELDVLFDASGVEEGASPLGEVARASTALLAGLDRASAIEGVTVLGATRRSPGGAGGAGWVGAEDGGGGGGEGAAIPASFRKPGRFDRSVAIGTPTQAEREGIIRVLLSTTREWELEPLTAEAPLPDLALGERTAQGRRRYDLAGPESESRVASKPLADEKYRDNENNTEVGRGDARDPGPVDRAEALNSQVGVIAEWARRLSSVTPGMVGGDLERLVRTARGRAAQRKRGAEGRASLPPAQTTAKHAKEVRLSPQSQPPPQPSLPNVLTWRDAMGAVASTVPRSLRGMDVASFGGSGGDGIGGPTWSSVGGFSGAKRRLQRLVQWPWRHPEAFARMGVSAPAGALLYGPSGCGKSLVAQVLATECLANFVWVRSSELLSR